MAAPSGGGPEWLRWKYPEWYMQMSHAQQLRLHLAQVAQERRAQQHFRMVNPIRSFYGMG